MPIFWMAWKIIYFWRLVQCGQMSLMEQRQYSFISIFRTAVVYPLLLCQRLGVPPKNLLSHTQHQSFIVCLVLKMKMKMHLTEARFSVFCVVARYRCHNRHL